MNRCLGYGIGAGEKIIYNVRCEHYKLFFLFLIKLAALGAFFRKSTSPPLNLKRSSKTHQSSLALKGWSTSHLGLLPSGEKRKPLLLVALNHFILWMADHQRSTPAAELRFAGCDRLAEFIACSLFAEFAACS